MKNQMGLTEFTFLGELTLFLSTIFILLNYHTIQIGYMKCCIRYSRQKSTTNGKMGKLLTSITVSSEGI